MTVPFIILVLFPIVMFMFIALPTLFELAGVERKKAFIPIINIIELLKIIKHPKWWIIFLFVPCFGQLMMVSVLSVSFARKFHRFAALETIAQIFIPFIYFPYHAYIKKDFVFFDGEYDWKDDEMRKKRNLSDKICLFFASFGLLNLLVIILRIIGTKDKLGHKTLVKDWLDTATYAIIGAAAIRGYVLEAFAIPTPSMEKELLVGDFSFVNKISYGLRMPFTPYAYPLVHNTIPFTYEKSYTDIIKSEYTRLPALRSIKRNDILVFNYPDGDTAIFGRMPGQQGVGGELQGHSYAQFRRSNAFFLFQKEGNNDINYFLKNTVEYEAKASNMILNNNNLLYFDGSSGGVVNIPINGYSYRPVDRRENYIKRCVAIPGDTLEIIDGVLLIKGRFNDVGTNVCFKHYVQFNQQLNNDILLIFKKEYGFNLSNYSDVEHLTNFQYSNVYEINMSDYTMQAFTNDINAGKFGNLKFGNEIKKPERLISKKSSDENNLLMSYITTFPNYPSEEFNWTMDNYGPIWIPKKGTKIKMNFHNYILYRTCISTHEGNKIEYKNNKVYINNNIADSYTFKQNYYFMIGDNRHNSADSRTWGFVPHNHIVGNGMFVMFSRDSEAPSFFKSIRWNRIFKPM